jgi:hypothetical protein
MRKGGRNRLICILGVLLGAFPLSSYSTRFCPSPSSFPLPSSSILVQKQTNERCADGSTAVFYQSESPEETAAEERRRRTTGRSSPSSSSPPPCLIVYLDGGGFFSPLDDTPEAKAEGERLFNADDTLPSPPSHNGLSLLSGDPRENPLFFCCRRVYVPYCSKDMWTGSGGSYSTRNRRSASMGQEPFASPLALNESLPGR